MDDSNPFFSAEDIGGGDEFLAIEPWKGQMREPNGWRKPPVNQNKAPNVNLELQWVHGYRTRDSRNNIGIMAD